ncbi:PREDICTED: uncharacterized protein LOC104702341 [Camelina sativa]|uniref:Uncharacterized protein LOC104702341 n=1 Tax=Camelina sativa TaxID=90675 RepID=A0ABM0SUX2_CAMSA|nr:PREDICTED: uncharacterized protein LOC104702341 [Camelina sativa]
MQGAQEDLTLSLSITPVNRIVSQKPQPSVMPLGLVAPYHQQAFDINHMLQNQMTRELCTQLRSMEERAVFFMKLKDKAIEDMRKHSVEMDIRLRKALAEVEFWRKTSDEKSDLCRDLAGRLLKVRKRERAMKGIDENNAAEEAESSTGENGDDPFDTARTRLCKRRRL